MNWIIASVVAAFFQNLRFSLQKNLNKKISIIASTYVRFVFALPFSAMLFFYFFSDIELIKSSDYIVDLGPYGGIKGGELIFEGSPEKLVKNKKSLLTKFLKTKLG